MEGMPVQENPGKWNLSKPFVFYTNSSGSIRLVLKDPKDRDELLVVKKALTSLFHVHIQVDNRTNPEDWDYEQEEADHLGSLRHKYSVQRTDSGLQVHRRHFSVGDTHRSHEKVMRYDHQGTLQSAEARDNILVKSQTQNISRTKSLPGEAPHVISSSGPQPNFAAASHVTLQYVGRRPCAVMEEHIRQHILSSLVNDSLQTPRKKVITSLDQVQQNITKAWDCIHAYKEADHENRTACVSNLRQLLQQLNPDDYQFYVNSTLAAACPPPPANASCFPDRLVLIDIVARMGDVASQRLIVTHVLEKRPADEEELRRVFIHCVALQQPTAGLVAAVEAFCFGEGGELHGSRTLSSTQSRACLALGSLARHLQAGQRRQRRAADRLSHGLETWLDAHGHGDRHVTKREASSPGGQPSWMSSEEEAQHLSKAVLIHALGNGGLASSKARLLRHAQPNVGHHIWRRAALHALRHYNCSESARLMYQSLQQEEVVSVRRKAMSLFMNHPRRQEITRTDEDELLSQNYTYRAVARVKRAVQDKVLLSFLVGLPKYEWSKELGNADIGASFGARFQYSISGQFDPLKGAVHVDLDNKVWAEAHIGVFNLQVYIFRIEACYRGTLSYNVNIVKDFNVDLMRDVNTAFNRMIDKVIEPLGMFATGMAARLQDPTTGQAISKFQPLADAVQALPAQTQASLQAVRALRDEAEPLATQPMGKKLLDMTSQLQALLEDVNGELVDKFTSIADISQIAFPFAENEIRSAINSVIGVVGKLTDYPNQALNGIVRGKLRFQLAMMRIVEGSKIIKQAFSSLSGGSSSWNNAGEDMRLLVTQVKSLLDQIAADAARSSVTTAPFSSCETEGLSETAQRLRNISVELVKQVEVVLTQGPAQLQRALDLMNNEVELLKTSFAEFTQAVDVVKSRIFALFGVKFHPSFPNQRRDCSSQCGCGFYPTDCHRYGHPGIDLLLNRSQEVTSPLSGMVYKEGGSVVRIKPETADLSDYEIIISNIRLHSNYSGQTEFYLESGQVLGWPLGSKDCTEDHVHVAMKRSSQSNMTGLCQYVDPSPFLDTIQPVPVWKQECKDFAFEHIGQIIDFKNLGGGFKKIFSSLGRDLAVFLLNHAMKQVMEQVKEAIPENSPVAFLRDIEVQFSKSSDNDTSNFKMIYSDGMKAAKNFVDDIKTRRANGKTVQAAANRGAKPGSEPGTAGIQKTTSQGRTKVQLPKTFAELKQRTAGALARVMQGLRNSSAAGKALLGNEDTQAKNSSFWDRVKVTTSSEGEDELPASLKDAVLPSLGVSEAQNVFSDLRNTLSGLKDLNSGSKDHLLARMKVVLQQRLCPDLGKLLQSEGSPCIPHKDCAGLSCDFHLRRKQLITKLSVDVIFRLQSRTTVVSLAAQNYTLLGDADQTFATGVKVFGTLDVKLKVRTAWFGSGGQVVRVWLAVQACGPLLCCLPDVLLLRGLNFTRFTAPDLGYLLSGNESQFELLPLETSYKVFADLGEEGSDIAATVLGIKGIILKSFHIVIPPEVDYLPEFKNPLEVQESGQFPLPGQLSEINIQVFAMNWPYLIGPVILNIHIDVSAVIGVTFDVEVRAVDSYIQSSLAPFVAVKIDAGVTVTVLVLSFGVDLIGYIARTRFPLILTANFGKLPIITSKRLDLVLIPLELKLVVWVEIRLGIKFKVFFIEVDITFFVKRWDYTIWHWTSPAIRATIWNGGSQQTDTDPPQFLYCGASGSEECSAVQGRRRRRAVAAVPGLATCRVQQLLGRHHKDVAFRLDFSVADDKSDLTLSYAVGDYPGGTNVRPWTRMQGSVMVVPEGQGAPGSRLPCGKPLHFLARAVNSQGLSTEGRCALSTLDCTLPDGRVDAESRCSSHRHRLAATLVLFDDSLPDPQGLTFAVGYGPGAHGDQVVDWQTVLLENRTLRSDAMGSLRYFTEPRPGRLSAPPLRARKTVSEAACGDECLKDVTCVAFTFNPLLFDCELQAVTEGAAAERLEDGHFLTYERLGQGYSARLESKNLQLRHGVRYYVNSAVTNVMGYQTVLTSKGVMVDHTPPEPGRLGEGPVVRDVAGGCNASIIQRCRDLVDNLTHNHIIDGKGASTVFNGNRRGQDLVFTFENHMAAANWDGFHDDECGIYGYTWAVGTTLCGTDVSSFADPHVATPNPEDWSHVGVVKNLNLAEGAYYVTVQAVSDVSLGGDLVTTVCHSTPFFVDVTPPVLHSVSDVIFDDGFRLLAVYFNASDNLSGLREVEFGLGATKYDVSLRAYLPFRVRGSANNTYLVNDEFQTPGAVPAWIRLRVTDNVGLSATGHGATPVLVDMSAPVTGQVLDGSRYALDARYSNSSSAICVQWRLFEDPESHIDSYRWGVGSSPGQDDVVRFHPLSPLDRQACWTGLQLRHNATYFSTVIATNKALNQKSVNVSSDGVTIDVTPPEPGRVVDGPDVTRDLRYTSEEASVTSSWLGFGDPESGVASYTVRVLLNGLVKRQVAGWTQQGGFADHTLALSQGDEVKVQVEAFNGAGSSTTATSDGLLVDHTAPVLLQLGSVGGAQFQQDQSSLRFVWKFQDAESGVVEYRCAVYQQQSRSKVQFWPAPSSSNNISSGGSVKHIVPVNSTSAASPLELYLQNLTLVNGATYSLQVTAVNFASLSSVEESKGVTIDSTPPDVDKVLLAAFLEEEDVNDQGRVEHVQGEPLYVTWTARDWESSVVQVELCVSLEGVDCLTHSAALTTLSGDALRTPTATLSDVGLLLTSDTASVTYRVLLRAVNGAGAFSTVATSRPFVVLQGNVAGVVHDGRDVDSDIDVTRDRAAVAFTFSGFSSQACGIEAYQWGVGSSPFATDLLPFSDDGLVRTGEGSGQGQGLLDLPEGLRYYVTVRASTGHDCREAYVASSSDGVTVDARPPTVAFHRAGQGSAPALTSTPALTSADVVVQTGTRALELGWSVTDAGSVNRTLLVVDLWRAGRSSSNYSAPQPVPSQSLSPQPLATPLTQGDAVFPALWAQDEAGNEVLSLAPWVIADTTAPTLQNFTCTPAVSLSSTLMTCTWTAAVDPHSALTALQVGLGSSPVVADLVPFQTLQLHQHRWQYDLLQLRNASSSNDLNPFGVTNFYAIARVTNAAYLASEWSAKVIVDVTLPEITEALVVTSPSSSGLRVARVCQTVTDFMEISISGLQDSQSGIDSVEVALGSNPGSSDLYPYLTYALVNGVYARGGLALKPGSLVHPTLKVTNGVGLSRLVHLAGVVISPEPRLTVLDGPEESDQAGQSDLTTIQGQWQMSDNCPVVSGSWWVTEADGATLVRGATPLTRSNVTGAVLRHFYDDTLTLLNLRTYVSHVRITDAANRTLQGRSDGVTVSLEAPDPGEVWEGAGAMDMDYQVSTTSLMASWKPFGNPRSTLPFQRVTRYLVALGTGRELPETRTNVHGFQDAGLATAFVLHGLNLTAKTVSYYVTVRAVSAAGTMSESSSDGVRAGYSGQIEVGRLLVDSHQSSISEARVGWEGFRSDMGDLSFYTGLSSAQPPWDNATYDCQAMLENDFPYDLRSLTVAGPDVSIVMLSGLNLTHNGSFYVTVVAQDLMLHCAAVVSGPIVVDTTPPSSGEITVVGHDAGFALFINSSDTVWADLSSLSDQESGVGRVSVELRQTSHPCADPAAQDFVVASVTAVNESQVVMRGLALEENTTYYLTVTATNRAQLQTQALSKPLLLRATPPTPGVVKLSSNWTEGEKLYTPRTDLVQGLISLRSLDDSSACKVDADVLHEGGRWETILDPFGADCVDLQAPGGAVRVLLQHSKDLSGVDKGAVRQGGLAWVEGNYTFLLRAAGGEKVLTAISLTSRALLPPFLAQHSLLFPSLSGSVCDPESPRRCNGTNSTAAYQPPEGQIGVGMALAEINGTWRGLFWVQDRARLRQTAFSPSFDPSAAEAALYVFSLKLLADGSWEVAFCINGAQITSANGVRLAGEMALNFNAWNVEGYVPPVLDPLASFRTAATLGAAAVPLTPRQACSYGAAFHDAGSGVTEVWAAVSSGLTTTADVAPYRRVATFCPPCLLGCPKLCPVVCNGHTLVAGFQVLPVVLSDLALQPANEAMMQSKPANVTGPSNSLANLTEPSSNQTLPVATYYLTVKVVTSAGLEAVSRSSGVLVDTSPPTVSNFFCFDPIYADDEKVELVGSNSTVGAQWTATDDVTLIESQRVSVGTQPGIDDVTAWVAVDRLATNYTFTNIQPPMAEGRTYHLSLRVRNTAGLDTLASVSFTVRTTPPDMSVLAPTLDDVSRVVNVSGERVAVSNRTESVGVNFNFQRPVDGGNTLDTIEYAVGTAPGQDDLFPRSVVGNANTSSVGLVNGYVHIQGHTTNITVGNYANSSFDNSGTRSEGALYSMEPGRCQSQTITGMSAAHVPSQDIDMGPVCIQREGDNLVMANPLDAVTGRRKRSNTVSSLNGAQLLIPLAQGGVLTGSLGPQDLQGEYGTAASSTFRSYIVFPEPDGPTSRALFNRVHSLPGPHFYVSPLSSARFAESAQLTYLLPDNVTIPTGFKAALLVWDAYSQKWKLPEEFCTASPQTFNNQTRLVTSRICQEVFQRPMEQFPTQPTAPGRRRRRAAVAASTPAFTPRMFSLSVLGPYPPNSPPTLGATTFTLPEDGALRNVSVPYTDAEGDVMTFRTVLPPAHGEAAVTSDGSVTYVPRRNYVGSDQVVVEGVEVLDVASLAEGAQPRAVNASFVFNVVGVNDAPEILYVTSAASMRGDVQTERVTGVAAGNGLNFRVLVEGNTTTSVDLGIILFGDPDAVDTLTYISRAVNDVNATLNVSSLPLQEARQRAAEPSSYWASGVEAKVITLTLGAGYNGSLRYDARVKDGAGLFSQQLTLAVHVLINPCVHGQCSPRSNVTACLDPQRASTFNPYQCHCDPGYEGAWCQLGINECQAALCGPIHDCVDLLNDFQCQPNPWKAGAVGVGSVLLVVVLAVGVYLVKRTVDMRESKKEKEMDNKLSRHSFDQHKFVKWDDASSDSLTSDGDVDRPRSGEGRISRAPYQHLGVSRQPSAQVWRQSSLYLPEYGGAVNKSYHWEQDQASNVNRTQSHTGSRNDWTSRQESPSLVAAYTNQQPLRKMGFTHNPPASAREGERERNPHGDHITTAGRLRAWPRAATSEDEPTTSSSWEPRPDYDHLTPQHAADRPIELLPFHPGRPRRPLSSDDDRLDRSDRRFRSSRTGVEDLARPRLNASAGLQPADRDDSELYARVCKFPRISAAGFVNQGFQD